MAYVDKCFYFDFDDRMIPIRDSDEFEELSLRWVWNDAGDKKKVGIELWGRNEDGVRKHDVIVPLERTDACLLATRLLGVVQELAVDEQIHDEIELTLGNYDNIKKSGLGAFLDTPMGKDALGQMDEDDGRTV